VGFAATAQRLAARAMRVLGNDVVVNGFLTGRGQLMAPGERILDGMVISTGWELEYPPAVFGRIERGAALEIDGVLYKAREDGRETGDAQTELVALQNENQAEGLEVVIDGGNAGSFQ
jgi:hypothetical protein